MSRTQVINYRRLFFFMRADGGRDSVFERDLKSVLNPTMSRKVLLKRNKPDPFQFLAISSSVIILIFILLPLIEMVFQPSMESLKETLHDRDVVKSIGLSIYSSCLSTCPQGFFWQKIH